VVSDVTALAPALPFPFSSRRPPPRPTLFPYTTLFRSPPHVLVLQVTGRRPLVDAYGQGVGSGTQKRSDVELARQSTAGGKAQFGAVEPDPEEGVHAFEPKDRRPFRPVFGQGEFTPVVSGGVFVWYVRRIDRERVRGVGVCGRPVSVELPVRGHREQVPPRGVESGLFEPFGRGVGPAV